MSERARTRPGRRAVVVVVAVVVALVGVVAGAVVSYRHSGQATVLTTDGGLHVVVGERAEAVAMSAVEAKITKVGRCIGLGGQLTIWPHGTEVVSGDRIRVGRSTYGIGDRFLGAGSTVEKGREREATAGVDVPAGCPIGPGLNYVGAGPAGR